LAARRFLDLYLSHMQVEDFEVLPLAEKVLADADWVALDAAFAGNCDPLNSKFPRDPLYDRLFTRIVMSASSH
jgi:hypothetical protein